MALRFRSRPILLAVCCSMSLGAHVANALVLHAFSIDAQTTKAAKGASPEVLLVDKWVCWITMTL